MAKHESHHDGKHHVVHHGHHKAKIAHVHMKRGGEVDDDDDDKRARGGHVSHHKGKHHVVHHGHHMPKIVHHHRKRGGGVADPGHDVYAGASSNVVKEAEERKHGGRAKKDGHFAEGGRTRARLDRPGRKRGGGVGSDMRPLTTAHNAKDADGHKTDKVDFPV